MFGGGRGEVVCGQVWWPILGICALHLTHPSAHTHSSEHTPEAVGSQCCGAQGAETLAQGSHLSRGHSPHLQSLPDLRLEPTTFGLQVRLYPLGHDCPLVYPNLKSSESKIIWYPLCIGLFNILIWWILFNEKSSSLCSVSHVNIF